MKDLAWTVIFTIEVGKYLLGGKLCFDEYVKRKKAYPIMLILYFSAVMVNQKAEWQYLQMYLFVIVTVMILIWENGKTTIFHMLILLMSITSMDGIVEKLLECLLLRNGIELQEKVISVLFSSMVSFGILIICSMIKKITEKKNIKKKRVSDYIWIVVIAMLANVLLTSAGLYVVRDTVNDVRFEKYLTITYLYSYVSVILIVLFVAYIRNTNSKLEQMIEVERQLKDAQEQYYLALLQKEENTRKSRHDWCNHLICMSGLANRENAKETERYISALMNQMYGMQEICHDTGNDIINILLNHYAAKNQQAVSIRVCGRLKSKILITDVDLCVIISNILENAIEYIKKHPESGNNLYVLLEEGNIYQRIVVENYVSEDVTEETLKKTSKSDKENHGIGISNVKEAVKRNGGNLKIGIQERKMRAEIIFKSSATE